MERKGLEFSVGIFIIVGLLCLAYLSISLGHLQFGGSHYKVTALFSTVSGLKAKAPVTMAGVNIGTVETVRLKDGQALVICNINNDVQLEDDSVASIKTSGIIGDKYIQIAPGASEGYIKAGGVIRETRPPLDIEGLISKFVFGSIEGKENKDGKDNKSKPAE
ncbi:MAG: outer membrane lipid asymmetry maintenance protein MlaD [Syntrophobacteraceae bacterium]